MTKTIGRQADHVDHRRAVCVQPTNGRLYLGGVIVAARCP